MFRVPLTGEGHSGEVEQLTHDDFTYIVGQMPLLTPLYDGDFDALFTVAYGATSWLAFLPNVAAVILVQGWVRRRRARAATIGGRMPAVTATRASHS